MGLCLGGLIIGRIFASETWGAYFQEGLFSFGGEAYCQNFTVVINPSNVKIYFFPVKIVLLKLFVRSKYTSMYVELLDMKSSLEDKVNKVIE